MTTHNNTADGSKGNNENLSPFAKAMADVFSLHTRTEGVSAKLIQSMYEMETTFDFTFCERYVKAVGSAKTEMLDKTLADLVPSFVQLKEGCDIKPKDFNNPTDIAHATTKRDDSRRKMKTAQNTLRQCCLALAFLRIGPAKTDDKNSNKLIFKTPIVKIDVKNGKVRIATEEGWESQSYYSVSELVKFGQNCIEAIGWNANKPSGTPRTPGSSVQKTVEKTKATNGHFQGAIKEMGTAITSIVRTADYEKLPETDLEALRNLEVMLLRKVYGDANGFIDIETLCEVVEGYNKDLKPAKDVKNVNKEAKAA